MKAVIFKKYGPPEVLQYQEIPTPFPKENEVQIKLKATAINEWDWGILHGKPFINQILFGLFKPRKNILGCDIAGIVERVGEKVTKFQPGDEVYGDISERTWGGFAEYVCASEEQILHKPASISFEEAAAIPQAAALAIQGLKKGEIHRRKKILINGAGGGVGSFAIPYAKLHGSEVTGVDNGEKLDFMKELGADHVIDYTREDFSKNGKKYDLILGAVAYRSLHEFRRSLTPEGVFVMLGGSMKRILQFAVLSPFFGKQLKLVPLVPNGEIDAVIDMIEAGKIRPKIDKVFPLSETAEAFRYYGKGGFKGKIVVRMD